MFYLLLTSGCLIAAIAVNTASVYVQRNYRYYDRFASGQAIHSLVIVPFWIGFIILLGGIDRAVQIRTLKLPLLGLGIVGLAGLIFIAAVRQLGSGALVNSNFFAKRPATFTDNGIYRYLKNPIYDSYVLAMVGAGLWHGNAAYYVLAIVCFIGLNLIESKVESAEAPSRKAKV